MSGPDRDELERRLRELRAPDEQGARDRGLSVVRRAVSMGSPAGTRRFRPVRVAAVAAAALAVTIGLTPAGASVRAWIDDTVTGVENERPGLSRLPAAGRVLATSAGGAWIVDEDGSRRRLGPYRDASWSPQGLHVAAARGRQLVAVDPQGEVKWAISRRARVSTPQWAPSGIRIVYRSGRDLRLIEGDGDNDQRLVPDAAPVAPQWRPPPAGATAASHVLAYVEGDGSLVIRDVESGAGITATHGVEPTAIAWLSHDRLVAADNDTIEVLTPRLRTVATVRGPAKSTIEAIATSPSTGRIAVIRTRAAHSGGARAELESIRFGPDGPQRRTLFSGPGQFSDATFSPDGRWLLLGWADADQWLFLRPAAQRKLLQSVVAVGDISRQLDPSGERPSYFPTIEGWCCAPQP